MKKRFAIFLTALILSANGLFVHGQDKYSIVKSPEIPAVITLCGEKIDLDRTEFYESFDRELTSIIYNHGTSLLIIKRANRYFLEIVPILKANGVPEDFIYLAVAESSLSPRAYSPAKAAGIWQFIPSTAKQYGLEVNDDVDERYNIEKATAAACRYFKNAYKKYGSWFSVMSSFNGGQARISKELEAQNVPNSLELYLAEETTRYPYRIAAYKEFITNPRKYGYRLTDNQLYYPREYTTETVSEPIESWVEWAQKRGITFAQLRDANPWIRSKTLPNKTGKSYTVKIPVKTSFSRKKANKKVYFENWTID